MAVKKQTKKGYTKYALLIIIFLLFIYNKYLKKNTQTDPNLDIKKHITKDDKKGVITHTTIDNDGDITTTEIKAISVTDCLKRKILEFKSVNAEPLNKHPKDDEWPFTLHTYKYTPEYQIYLNKLKAYTELEKFNCELKYG